MGRFTQVDSFPGMLGAPATQHPYAYGLNNPVRYSDPSGEFVGALLFSMALAGGIATYQYFQQHPGTTLGCAMQDGEFRRQVGIAIAIGAVSGALGGLLGGLKLGATFASALGVGELTGAILAGAVTGGILGGFSEGLRQLFYGEQLNVGRILAAAASGALFGGVMGAVGYGLRKVVSYLANRLSSNASNGGTVRVYRVEGRVNNRIKISDNGRVRILGRKMLFLNFGEEQRALELYHTRVTQNMDGVMIKSFEVPTTFLDYLSDSAVPEQLVREFPHAPIVVDITKAPHQYGLRVDHIEQLIEVIVQGSGYTWP